MARHHAPRRRADGPRGDDVLALAKRERLSSREVVDPQPAEEAEQERKRHGVQAEVRADEEQQVEGRDVRERLYEPDDDVVPPATEITGRDPEEDTDGHRDERRERTDRERHAAAIQEPHDLAAAELVAAEHHRGLGQARLLVGGEDVLLAEAPVEDVVGEQVRARRQQDEEQQRAERGDRRRVPAQSVERVRPEAGARPPKLDRRQRTRDDGLCGRHRRTLIRGWTQAYAMSRRMYETRSSSAPMITEAWTIG